MPDLKFDVLGIAAIITAARASLLLSLVWSARNFIPAARGPDGCPICQPQTLLSAETEQILIILGSLVVLAVAWMIWRKA